MGNRSFWYKMIQMLNWSSNQVFVSYINTEYYTGNYIKSFTSKTTVLLTDLIFLSDYEKRQKKKKNQLYSSS